MGKIETFPFNNYSKTQLFQKVCTITSALKISQKSTNIPTAVWKTSFFTIFSIALPFLVSLVLTKKNTTPQTFIEVIQSTAPAPECSDSLQTNPKSIMAT